MSDNNIYLISDIDDSEGEELSGVFKHNTINIPDQASNSDDFLEYNNPKQINIKTSIQNFSQNLISNEENKMSENSSDKIDNSEDQIIVSINKGKSENTNSQKEINLKDESSTVEYYEDDESCNNGKVENNEIDDETDYTEEEDESDNNIEDENNENDEDTDYTEEESCNNTEDENNQKDVKKDYFEEVAEEDESYNDEKDETENNENDEIEYSEYEEDGTDIEKEEYKAKNNLEDYKYDENLKNEIKNFNQNFKNNSMSNGIRKMNESLFNADDEKDENDYNDYDDKNNNNTIDNKNNNNIPNIDSSFENTIDDIENYENKIVVENVAHIENELEVSNDFADESYIEDIDASNSKEIIDNYTNEIHRNTNKEALKNDINKSFDIQNEEGNNHDNIKESIVQPSEPLNQRKNNHSRRRRNRHSSQKNKTIDDNQHDKNDKENEIIKPQISDNTEPKANKKQSKGIVNNQADKIKEEPLNYTIDEIADISINNGDYSLLNQSNVEKVMSRIRQMQRNALEEGDYDLAKKTHIASQSAMRYYHEKQLLKHNSDRACEINIKLQATRDDINFLKEHWMHVLENAKQKANDDLLQLKNEQDEEMKNFDDYFDQVLNDPNIMLPVEYRKPSSTVLELKRKQAIYISTNKFQSAKILKKEIEKLNEKERKENILKYQKKLITERNLLIQKQDSKFETRRENWIRTIEGIKSVANYEIEHARKCEKQLENKYNQTNELSNSLIRQHQQSSLIRQKRKGQLSKISQPSERQNARLNTSSQLTNQKDTTKTGVQEFRQRAMINRIIYTNRIIPKVRKPISNPRARKQYTRTPR